MRRTIAPRQFQTHPKSTPSTASRPGGAGCWDGTRARQTVSLSPTLSCQQRAAVHLPPPAVTLCLAPIMASRHQRGRPSLRLRPARLRSFPLHPRGAASQRRAVQRRQHLLPVSGNTAGNAQIHPSIHPFIHPNWSLSANTFRPLGTAPVLEGPHREHLHRRALRSVLVTDQCHAQNLEASSSALRYDLSFSYIFEHTFPTQTSINTCIQPLAKITESPVSEDVHSVFLFCGILYTKKHKHVCEGSQSFR